MRKVGIPVLALIENMSYFAVLAVGKILSRWEKEMPNKVLLLRYYFGWEIQNWKEEKYINIFWMFPV